jgi:hypothetical protein
MRQPNTVKREIWIGLADVVALPGCKRLGRGKGAFVKVVLWADSDSDFYSKAKKAISELDLHLSELEDREPLVERLSRIEAGDETLQMAETVRMNPDSVVFGTFHIWEKTDA